MYGKVFSSIFDSTLVSDGGFLPTYIFMSMIALADKDGIVSISPKALFRRLGFGHDNKITFDDFVDALEFLQTEDRESNSPDLHGKRVIPLSKMDELEGNRGWYLVNYDLYRKKSSKLEPQGSSTDRVRRYRERKKNKELQKGNGKCNGMERNETNGNGHIDTDTDTDIKDINPISEIPFQLIVDSYNQHCTKLPQCRKLTKKRQSAIKARWNEAEEYQTLVFWNEFFVKVNSSPFLTGDNNRHWKADIDFCISESKFTKIIEGSYSSDKESENLNSSTGDYYAI